MNSSPNPPLDSRQLRAFVALARLGSFTLAAKDLGLTQSAVSHSMKALETDVGCRLFDRMSKKVLLTHAGEQLLTHAEKILGEMTRAREAITTLNRWGRARLRVAASTSACQYILPGVLCGFQKEYPDSNVIIEPGDTRSAVELLRANVVDLAVAMEPRADAEFDFVPVFTDELLFMVSPSHPWAKLGRATREEIPRQRYILYRRNSSTSQLIEDFFREENMTLNRVTESGSNEAIKEMAKVSLGVGILAPWTARKELDAGELVAVPLGRRKLRRSWGILHYRERRLSMAEETFVKHFHAAAARFGVSAEEEKSPGAG
jgi:DNA-binding transcriptional LysR family regulator